MSSIGGVLVADYPFDRFDYYSVKPHYVQGHLMAWPHKGRSKPCKVDFASCSAYPYERCLRCEFRACVHHKDAAWPPCPSALEEEKERGSAR